jgi:hypothetical protein
MDSEKKSLYIETTIPSYARGRTSPDEAVALKQKVTKKFWEEKRHNYALITSQFTIAECSRGNPEAAGKRLDFLSGIQVLSKTPETEALAMVYKKLLQIPDDAETDCLHLAVCVLNRIDFLLSWNCRHLGDVSHDKIMQYNTRYGLWTPALVTPENINSFMETDV